MDTRQKVFHLLLCIPFAFLICPSFKNSVYIGGKISAFSSDYSRAIASSNNNTFTLVFLTRIAVVCAILLKNTQKNINLWWLTVTSFWRGRFLEEFLSWENFPRADNSISNLAEAGLGLLSSAVREASCGAQFRSHLELLGAIYHRDVRGGSWGALNWACLM